MTKKTKACSQRQLAGPRRKSQRLEALQSGTGASFSPVQLEQLPEELLTRILSELDEASLGRCAQLNRRWQRLATQQCLLLKFRIRGRPMLAIRLRAGFVDLDVVRLTVAQLNALLSRSPDLQSLTISHLRCPSVGEESPQVTLGRRCQSLQCLKIIQCDEIVTADALQQLRAGCPDLSVLHIELRARSSESLLRPVLAALSDALAPLRLFYSEYSFRIAQFSSRDFDLGFDYKVTVKDCKLGSLFCVPDIFFATLWTALLTSEDVARLQRTNLLVLELQSCTLSNRVLRALLDSCPELVKLDIESCSGFRTGSYPLLAGGLPDGLQQLHLTSFSSPRLTEADLEIPLPPSLTKLTLDIRHRKLTGLGLLKATATCSGLTDLTLPFLHDDLLPALLAQLPRLRSLHVQNAGHVTSQCWANLRSLATFPTELQEFEAILCSESSLTDGSLENLCASPVARGLRELSLSYCDSLTSAAFGIIASGCPQLEFLELFNRKKFPPRSADACRAFRAAFERHRSRGTFRCSWRSDLDHLGGALSRLNDLY